MHSKDKVCTYLLEAVKPDAHRTFEAAGLRWLEKEVLSTVDEMESHFLPIRIRASRARKTGSKISAGLKLRGETE